MLHITPLGIPVLTWAGIGYVTGFCALVSFLVPVAHALASYALDNSKRAQERRRRELPEIARLKIAQLSQRVLEAEDLVRVLEAENAKLRGLCAADRNFHRAHDIRVRAVETGRDAG